MKKSLSLLLAVMMLLSTLAVFPMTASAETVWDGSTSAKPMGSGSEDDPYLIESGEHLYWMATVASGGAGDQYNLHDYFNGVYFKQTADIDLGNHTIPSIGAYVGANVSHSTATHKYSVFGGNYNGQGFVIRNGKVKNSNGGTNSNWPTGLFGIIRGATIENVTLENFSLAVTDKQIFSVGLLVGYAMAESEITWVTPADSTLNGGKPYQQIGAIESYTDDYNRILGCTVSGSMICTSSTTAEKAYWGGIVGLAYNTTIENCTANVTMTVSQAVQNVGGIVGTVGVGCTVRNCINNSNVTLNGADKLVRETTVGGIVGKVYPETANVSYGKGLLIENCINNGSFTKTAVASANLVVGGILGAGNTLSLDENVIKNCYNLADHTLGEGTDTLVRVAALVGCGFVANNAKVGYLELLDCATVAIEKGRVPTNYVKNDGTGAVATVLYTQRSQPDGAQTVRKTAGGKSAIEAEGCVVMSADAIKASEGYQAVAVSITAARNAAIEGRTDEIVPVSTRIKPAGSGSETDPYLIDCAENLEWMSYEIRKTGTEKNLYSDPFADTYFVQVCDIDLGGRALSSIGFYHSASYDYSYNVFGGHYNGQGFAIRNGYVVEPNTGHDSNINWAGGLFGMICGATIENLNLENIKAVAKNVVGVLVGRALPQENGAADATHNQIRNCSTDAACYARTTVANTASSFNPDSVFRIGGLIGFAQSVTVEGCTNNATVISNNGATAVGGVAGSVGFGTVIRNCINNGTVVLDTNNTANTSESAYGGIAGAILPASLGTVDGKVGNVTIEKCLNTGHLLFLGVTHSNSIYWGGILGGSSNPNGGGTYVIRDCYNMQGANVYSNSKNYNGNADTYKNYFRVGGLVGCAYQNASGAGYVQLIDSYSVAPTGVKTTYLPLGGLGNANNNTAGSSTAAGGAGYSLVVKVGSTTYKATQADAIKAACIKSAADIADMLKTANITGQVKITMPEKLPSLFVQKSADGRSIRFIAAIKGRDWDAVGMEILASYTVDGEQLHSKRNTFECDVVYSAVKTGNGYMTAPEGTYYAVVTINNVPTEKGDVTFRVMPYAKTEGETVKGLTLGYVYKQDSTDLSALTLGNAPIASASVTYDSAAGSVNVAEMLQTYLNGKGAAISLGDGNATNTIHFAIDTTLNERSWKITVTETGITVTADAAYGLIAAYEYLLPRIALASDELTDVIKSTQGSYESLAPKTGDLRILYHNVLSYTTGLSIAERADLMLLTYKAYRPDVLCMQEASHNRFWSQPETAALKAWMTENYVEIPLYTNRGIGNPIFVRKDAGLTVKTQGYTVSRGDKGTGWVVLEKNGKTFAVLNSHFEANTNANNVSTVGDEYRRISAAKLVEIVNTIQSAYGCPVITGGDYNSTLHSDAGVIMTYGGSFKSLVKYNDLPNKTGYTFDLNAYAMRDGSYVYSDTATTYAGGLTSVRHLVESYTNCGTTHGVTYLEDAGRFQTVSTLGGSIGNAIDHILYRAGNTALTLRAYHIIDDCFALTSSDHAPHFVDISFEE